MTATATATEPKHPPAEQPRMQGFVGSLAPFAIDNPPGSEAIVALIGPVGNRAQITAYTERIVIAATELKTQHAMAISRARDAVPAAEEKRLTALLAKYQAAIPEL